MIASSPAKGIEDPEIKNLAKIVANFSFDLYSKLNHKETNLFYSPYFIIASLCCLSNGAKESTLEEFCKIFRQKINTEQFNSVLSKTMSRLNSTRKRYACVKEGKTENRIVDWRSSSLIYLPHDYIIEKDFTELVTKTYNANFFMQFGELSSEDIRLKINDWVRDKSKKKIKELMKPGEFPDKASLSLFNIVYFKGDWENEFDKDNTGEDEFVINAKKSVTVPIMMQMNIFKCMDTKLFSVLEMPILGNNLSMLIFLPKEPQDLEELENSLSYDLIEQCVAKMKYYSVMLYLPIFKLDIKVDLKDIFNQMGFEALFDSDRAKFTGICQDKPVHISSLLHQSQIEVKEDGTDWIQSIQLPKESEGIMKEFNANRPFIFIIRHNETGLIIFTGKVVDPTEFPMDS